MCAGVGRLSQSCSAYPSGSIGYTYSATQNNGQITQAVDAVSGETISYQYDALKRLISASSTPTPGPTPAAWTQTFQYDGFGNLTAKVLNGTTTTIPVDPTTNRLTSSYDANGNMLTGGGNTITYDGSNRIASVTPGSGGTEYFVYDPENKPVYRLTGAGQEVLTFYGVQGEKLSTFGLSSGCSDPTDYTTCWYYTTGQKTTSVWFGGKLIWSGTGTGYSSGPVYADKLGTNRMNGARYYPYGEEIGTATINDHEKFATYTRSSFSGLDYADQRYYASSYGRFNTPDPGRSAHPKSPLSWNRYAYVGGDPINRNDRRGLCYFDQTNGVGYDTYEDWQQAVYQGNAMSSDTTSDQGGAPCDGGLQVFACDLGNCNTASQCMTFASGTGNNGSNSGIYEPPDPDCVQNALLGASSALGLDVTSFQQIGVQIAGTSNGTGGTYSETELNLEDGDVAGLITQLCNAGFYSNGQCPSNNSALVGPPHTISSGPNAGSPFTGNFRAPGLLDSMQVNTSLGGYGSVQIDIDPFNPAADPVLGAILHGLLQVLPNMIQGSDNTYGCSH